MLRVLREFIDLILWEWVLPLQIKDRGKINFGGQEIFHIGKLSDYLIKPNIRKRIKVIKNGEQFLINVTSRIDTKNEIKYFERMNPSICIE